jgi:hypothetical protein
LFGQNGQVEQEARVAALASGRQRQPVAHPRTLFDKK